MRMMLSDALNGPKEEYTELQSEGAGTTSLE